MNRKINKYNQNPNGVNVETRLNDGLDELAAYEKFKQELLPKLRQAVLEGWSPSRIYELAGTYVAARSVDIALREQDSNKALAAIKEVLDRGIGKAVDKIETTHKYSKTSDEELDNILAAHLKEEDEDNGRDQPN